ncbi:MAG: HEAT repeat domain-containing protein [Chloroflexota bacterium]
MSKEDAIATILAQISATSDTNDTVKLIKVLKTYDDPRAIGALIDYTQYDSVPIVRTAIHALKKHATCDDLVGLLPLLKHEQAFIRKAVVETLGQSGCGDFVPHLVTLLGDDTLAALVREALIALKVDPNFF